jgi:DNA gyrase subunit A
MRLVKDSDEIMLITSEGVIIRMEVNEISILGRATQGVRLMRCMDETRVVGLARIEKEEDEEYEEDIEI